MEYIEHGDLGKYIAEYKTKVEAREITSQILEGLVILHERQICHRDLKPQVRRLRIRSPLSTDALIEQNILVASLSPIWVKISDFGIAKRWVGTSLKTHCGTPIYSSPEQLGMLPHKFRSLGNAYTNSIDIWALGVIVHEMLTLEIPFLDTYASNQPDLTLSIAPATDQSLDTALLHEYCKGANPFPSDSLRRACVGKDGMDFVKSLMAVDPGERVSAIVALASPWVQTRSVSQPAKKTQVPTAASTSRFGKSSRKMEKDKESDRVLDHNSPRNVHDREPAVDRVKKEERQSREGLLPRPQKVASIRIDTDQANAPRSNQRHTPSNNQHHSTSNREALYSSRIDEKRSPSVSPAWSRENRKHEPSPVKKSETVETDRTPVQKAVEAPSYQNEDCTVKESSYSNDFTMVVTESTPSALMDDTEVDHLMMAYGESRKARTSRPVILVDLPGSMKPKTPSSKEKVLFGVRTRHSGDFNRQHGRVLEKSREPTKRKSSREDRPHRTHHTSSMTEPTVGNHDAFPSMSEKYSGSMETESKDPMNRLPQRSRQISLKRTHQTKDEMPRHESTKQLSQSPSPTKPNRSIPMDIDMTSPEPEMSRKQLSLPSQAQDELPSPPRGIRLNSSPHDERRSASGGIRLLHLSQAEMNTVVQEAALNYDVETVAVAEPAREASKSSSHSPGPSNQVPQPAVYGRMQYVPVIKETSSAPRKPSRSNTSHDEEVFDPARGIPLIESGTPAWKGLSSPRNRPDSITHQSNLDEVRNVPTMEPTSAVRRGGPSMSHFMRGYSGPQIQRDPFGEFSTGRSFYYTGPMMAETGDLNDRRNEAQYQEAETDYPNKRTATRDHADSDHGGEEQRPQEDRNVVSDGVYAQQGYHPGGVSIPGGVLYPGTAASPAYPTAVKPGPIGRHRENEDEGVYDGRAYARPDEIGPYDRDGYMDQQPDRKPGGPQIFQQDPRDHYYDQWNSDEVAAALNPSTVESHTTSSTSAALPSPKLSEKDESRRWRQWVDGLKESLRKTVRK